MVFTMRYGGQIYRIISARRANLFPRAPVGLPGIPRRKDRRNPLEAMEPFSPLMALRETATAAPNVAVLHAATEFLDVTEYFFEFVAQADLAAQEEYAQNPTGEKPNHTVFPLTLLTIASRVSYNRSISWHLEIYRAVGPVGERAWSLCSRRPCCDGVVRDCL